MKTDRLQIAFSAWRFYLVNVVIVLIVAGLVARMIDLAVLKKDFLQLQGNARILRTVTEPAFRGMITDRNGAPLAISTSVFSVWINPKEFSATKKNTQALAKKLSLKAANIQKSVQRYQEKDREFMYVKRELTPALAKDIKALMIPGVYLQQDYKRFYPEGEIAAHVIGFTNVDDQGQEGLELIYNAQLAGVAGKKLVMKDRLGRIISNVQVMQDQRSGSDLALSIHRNIQYLAYRELMEGVKKNLAKSGSAIVLDAKTGEILAMVNQPSFNPNNIKIGEQEHFRNRAVTDIFEPGSTIKALTVAAGLNSGQFKANTVIDTPSWLSVDYRHLVKDQHRTSGPLTVTQILQLSSNVGVTKIALSLPPNQLWELLHQVGFGETTGIGFPGEQAGKLEKRTKWSPFTLATLSFGYGLSVTALQLAQAYAILANHGEHVPLSLLRRDQMPPSQSVMNPQVAQQTLHMLESVIAKGGTGQAAHVPGYRVAGKTGTVRMISEHGGYDAHRYVSLFVGVAPVTNPRLVVVVVVQDPQGKDYYGGAVAGPVFEKIMEGSLRALNIPPDDPQSLQQKEVV